MRSSYIYAVLTVLLWGSAAAVNKLLLADINNIQVLLFVSLFAAMSLFIIVMLQKKMNIIKTYTLKDYVTFLYMGFIGTFVYHFFFFGAIAYLPVQEALIINYLWPVMIIIFAAVILKEKFNSIKVAGILLSFTGVYIVITKGNLFALSFSNLTGILFAFAGAVSYGLFSVLGKKQNYDEFTSIMFYYFFTFILTLITALCFYKVPGITLLQLLGLLWVGVFAYGLGFVFWFSALKIGDTARMSNFILLTPFVSLVYAYFLVGEKIFLSSIAGLILIAAGIAIQSARRTKSI